MVKVKFDQFYSKHSIFRLEFGQLSLLLQSELIAHCFYGLSCCRLVFVTGKEILDHIQVWVALLH